MPLKYLELKSLYLNSSTGTLQNYKVDHFLGELHLKKYLDNIK